VRKVLFPEECHQILVECGGLGRATEALDETIEFLVVESGVQSQKADALSIEHERQVVAQFILSEDLLPTVLQTGFLYLQGERVVLREEDGQGRGERLQVAFDHRVSGGIEVHRAARALKARANLAYGPCIGHIVHP
jgi:hypothetical protein